MTWQVSRLEFDEAWSFVAKKQKRVTPEDGTGVGDQYVYLALAGAAKAIVSYRVGKRTSETTYDFAADVRSRVIGAPEISSDKFPAYPNAIREAFGRNVRFGTIDKHYEVEPAKAERFAEAAGRYLPELRPEHLTPDFAGIRPKLQGPGEPFRDFVLAEESANGAPGLINLLGIESPGLTASEALARRVAERVAEKSDFA